MALISPNTTSSTFGDSSGMLALLEAMDEDSALQGTDASRRKERHFDNQISLQKKKVHKMEKQIKAQFSGGLFKNIISLVTSVVSSVISFKLDSMKPVQALSKVAQALPKVAQAAQAMAVKALKAVAAGIQHLGNLVAQFDPFSKKAQQAGVDIERLQADILGESKQTEQARNVEQRARESRAKTQDAMNSYVRLKNEADSAMSKF